MRFANGTSATRVGGKNYQPKPATTSDPFVWGSVTKIITGVSILRAHEAGKLPDLDAK